MSGVRAARIFTWTDEMVDLLRDLTAQKMTAAQIADAINLRHRTDFTRNAVIGKCTRDGIALLSKSVSLAPRPSRAHSQPSAPQPWNQMMAKCK